MTLVQAFGPVGRDSYIGSNICPYFMVHTKEKFQASQAGLNFEFRAFVSGQIKRPITTDESCIMKGGGEGESSRVRNICTHTCSAHSHWLLGTRTKIQIGPANLLRSEVKSIGFPSCRSFGFRHIVSSHILSVQGGHGSSPAEQVLLITSASAIAHVLCGSRHVRRRGCTISFECVSWQHQNQEMKSRLLRKHLVSNRSCNVCFPQLFSCAFLTLYHTGHL